METAPIKKRLTVCEHIKMGVWICSLFTLLCLKASLEYKSFKSTEQWMCFLHTHEEKPHQTPAMFGISRGRPPLSLPSPQ